MTKIITDLSRTATSLTVNSCPKNTDKEIQLPALCLWSEITSLCEADFWVPNRHCALSYSSTNSSVGLSSGCVIQHRNSLTLVTLTNSLTLVTLVVPTDLPRFSRQLVFLPSTPSNSFSNSSVFASVTIRSGTTRNLFLSFSSGGVIGRISETRWPHQTMTSTTEKIYQYFSIGKNLTLQLWQSMSISVFLNVLFGFTCCIQRTHQWPQVSKPGLAAITPWHR